MKNLYFGKNDFFIKSISSNGKKSNDNEIIIIILEKN